MSLSTGNRKQRKTTGKAEGTIYAFILLAFFVSGAVVLALNCRFLYYLDIRWMKMESIAGLSEESIRANYDALIDYNLLWHREALVFPTLPMSETARIHFEEVKRIFDVFQSVFAVSGVLSVCILFRSRHRQKRWLKLTGILGCILPAALGVLVLIGWDRFFVAFHQLFFNNDYWLFDPVTDPIILYLPDGYFLQCAVLILAIVLVCSLWCIITGSRQRNK